MTIRFRAAFVAALSFLVGCGGGATVSGTVTLDGTALTAGTVTFHPVGDGPVGTGTIGSDGRYEITVGSGKSALPAGEYIVTVDAREAIDSSAAPTKAAPKAPKRITPARYADKDNTDLKATVTNGSNTVNLELRRGAPTKE